MCVYVCVSECVGAHYNSLLLRFSIQPIQQTKTQTRTCWTSGQVAMPLCLWFLPLSLPPAFFSAPSAQHNQHAQATMSRCMWHEDKHLAARLSVAFQHSSQHVAATGTAHKHNRQLALTLLHPALGTEGCGVRPEVGGVVHGVWAHTHLAATGDLCGSKSQCNHTS